MYLFPLTFVIQATCLLWAATPHTSNALETPQYTPLQLSPSQSSPTPIEAVAQNSSFFTNASSVSTLYPTWLENVKNQLARVIAHYEYRNAKALEILTTTWGFRSDEAEDFRRIHMELQMSPNVAVHYFTPIGGVWGAEWSQLRGTFPPEPDQSPYELLDMKVDLVEAVRVSKLAGFLGPWQRVLVRQLPNRDPYYTPGQMYYVFITDTGSTHAVGAIDRIVVKNFPQLSYKDPTSK